MTLAFIGLGSNMGDRLGFLQRAIKCLAALVGVHLVRVSSVYETEPVGPAPQAWFLNAVALVETSLNPAVLLTHTQGIERGLERVTTYRWGPRTIDLDILLYGKEEIKTATLQIPHPEICKRAFVMIPLLEICPEATLPDGTRVAMCLNALPHQQQVYRMAPATALASPPLLG